MSDEVRYERVGAAAVLTIDRPARRNAVDGATSRALREGFDAFVADDDARVLVLTGDGGTFCAGADLKDLMSLGLTSPSEGGPLGFTRLASPKPTIAAVEGWAVAGGLELALWCDLRIAADDAKFGCTERRWGVPLIDGGTIRLSRLIGHSRALDMILTGRPVGADEALACGLANRLVADGEARTAAEALAAQIAALPQTCMQHDRLSSYEQWGLPLADALKNECRHGRISLDSGDAKSGAGRFKEGEGRHGRF